MTLVWASGYNGITDPDAQTYIAAVEAADGQAIEGDVALAINDFVVGCKDDGIWDAIKASCILAGARTLSGALVPLKGTAPTNFNFVAGDYNRETGLVGDGSTKYISTGRNANQDPLNSYHLAVYVTEPETSPGAVYISAEDFGQRNTIYNSTSSGIGLNLKSGTNISTTGINAATVTGTIAGSRESSTSISYKVGTNQGTLTSSSVVSPNEITVVCARSSGGTISNYSVARYAFYSIGESLDLALLDNRVSTLMTDIGAAIP